MLSKRSRRRQFGTRSLQRTTGSVRNTYLSAEQRRTKDSARPQTTDSLFTVVRKRQNGHPGSQSNRERESTEMFEFRAMRLSQRSCRVSVGVTKNVCGMFRPPLSLLTQVMEHSSDDEARSCLDHHKKTSMRIEGRRNCIMHLERVDII